MINLCQFGAGRIGAIHAANIAFHPAAHLAAVVDIDDAAAQRFADRHGVAITTREAALDDLLQWGLDEPSWTALA